MYCEHTTFSYHNEFSKYMMIEEATSNDIFDYLLKVGASKFLLDKEKKYLRELFEKWDLKHLQLDEDFDDYSNNDGLEDIINIGDKGMKNLNMDD